MERERISCLAVFLVLCLNHSVMFSQAEKTKPHLIYVLEVRAKTTKVEEFENSVRELIGLFKKFEFPRSIVGDITEDYCYLFSTPIESYGDIDILYKDLAGIQKRMDADKHQILRIRFKDALKSTRSGVILKRPDLSYAPNEPRLHALEARYMRMDVFYIKAGREEEFEDFCKTLADQWQQKGVSEPFSVYAGQMGTDSPVYYLSMAGINPADFWSHAGRTWDHNGSEFPKLRKKIMPFCRKWEFNTGWLRLDLSFWPKKKFD